MNIEQHSKRDDMKVWLSQDEIDELLKATDSIQHEIAIGLMVRSGLRSHEVLDVEPDHIHDTDAGRMLRVWHGKGDKYRETPIPSDLSAMIRMRGEQTGSRRKVIDVTTTRAIRKWVSKTASQLVDHDDAWMYVSPHDLRRTWATQLHGANVDPLVVMDWGGWNDLDTFLDHYRGTSTPEAQNREREKVSWL